MQGKEERFKRIVYEVGGLEAAAKACKCEAKMPSILKALDNSWKNRLKNTLQAVNKKSMEGMPQEADAY